MATFYTWRPNQFFWDYNICCALASYELLLCVDMFLKGSLVTVVSVCIQIIQFHWYFGLISFRRTSGPFQVERMQMGYVSVMFSLRWL